MQRIILFAAAALLSAGCTKQNCNSCDSGSKNEITLSSEVYFGKERGLQDNQIFNGQKLSLFITPYGKNSVVDVIYDNATITANGTGGFTYSLPMYYPSDGSPVDIYAVHPYSETASLQSPMTFTVQADQTTQANYLNSDLLYANRVSVLRQTTTVPLTFHHRMSKLDFVITTKSTAIDLQRLTGISVLGLLPTMTLDLKSGSRTAATGTPTTIRAFGTAVTSGTAGDQTATGFSAIVVPQTATGGQRLFEIELTGYPTMYHTLVDDFGFAPGNRYTISLELSENGVALTSQIEDWVDGGTIGGPAGPKR